jgi:N-methylhydantoinase B/oxoprolinase/acetone carboxylase alpha subunit
MTAEFSGMSQFGVFVAGLTLEQASNGAPARAIADGENSAWCIYTPQADQGNAEVAELYFPVMFLGRGLEADSGGYGKFRGGLGHTAIWMVKNTPGIEYQCGCAGLRSKLVGNHGMYGAYPKWPERGSYAADTNMKELIEAQQPLMHERGDPSDPDMLKHLKGRVLATNLITPFVTPEALHEYDLIVHHVSGAQALGDPIEREPELIESDLDSGWTREWVAQGINAAVTSYDEKAREWHVDADATQRKRVDVREARKARGVPFKEWWKQERGKVAARENMDPAVLEMWRSSMRLAPKYGEDLRAFWQLPDDFTF